MGVTIIVMLVLIGMIEMAQYVFVDILPKTYDHVSDMVEAVIVFTLVVLLVRWRHYALYGQELVSKLREAERWREDMTAMLIHDLKNPVVSSALALQVVLRRQSRANSLSEEELGYLRMARNSQVRLSKMIGDLLTIAQAENGAIKLQHELLDLCAIATAVVDEMAPQARADQIDLRCECSAAYLSGDAGHLQRVVENLVANAIKFTPAGGAVTVATVVCEGEVQLRVSDTGPGIEPEAHDRIFHKFGQAATGHRMSVGLGLTFCKLIAEAHGGSIRLESRPGKGSTFVVVLPRHPDDDGEGNASSGTEGPAAE